MRKIIQITDFHLYKDPKQRLYGLVNTNDTLLDVLAVVKKEKPDLVIASGDLSDDGSKESYQRLQGYLSELNCDVYTIYGNHDHPANFDQYLIGGNVKKSNIFCSDFVNLLFINSFKENAHSGYITDDELMQFEDSLKKYDNCVVVVHHHFLPLKNIEPQIENIMDRYIMENGRELFDVITRYKSKIKFCVTGHVHNFYQSEIDGIKIYSCPSTCVQFAKTSEHLIEAKKKPAFLIYNFSNNNYDITQKSI